MSEDTVISHAEALRLIDEQIGEKVYVGFLVARAEPGDPEGPTPFVHSIGSLENQLAPKPPRLDPNVGYYQLGSESFCFPPMAGTIHLRDNGVDFRVADTVSIRVAWRGSKEVGNSQPNPELVAKLRAMGAANRGPEADSDVRQFLAEARSARAEILEASPTKLKFGSGEDERRIWNLRLRVHPEGEPAFEAKVEHGFRLSPDFEGKIERGYTFNMVPESGGELEVAYDPEDREQVIVHPPDSHAQSGGETANARSGAGTIRLVGIVGGPPERSADEDAPPLLRP
jgi:hypothetical protein